MIKIGLKWLFVAPVVVAFVSTAAKAEDGCGINQCCCVHRSVGAPSPICVTKSTDDCRKLYGGTCGHMGACGVQRPTTPPKGKAVQ